MKLSSDSFFCDSEKININFNTQKYFITVSVSLLNLIIHYTHIEIDFISMRPCSCPSFRHKRCCIKRINSIKILWTNHWMWLSCPRTTFLIFCYRKNAQASVFKLNIKMLIFTMSLNADLMSLNLFIIWNFALSVLPF